MNAASNGSFPALRRLRVAFLLLLLLAAVCLVLLAIPSSKSNGKRWQIAWTGSLSPPVVADEAHLHNGQPVYSVTRYSLGPFQLQRHNYYENK
jgi:hypothetical protein